jgi:hypothetical protein
MSDVRYLAISGAAVLAATLAFLCVFNRLESHCKVIGGEFHYVHGSALCLKPGTVLK